MAPHSPMCLQPPLCPLEVAARSTATLKVYYPRQNIQTHASACLMQPRVLTSHPTRWAAAYPQDLTAQMLPATG